VTRRVLHVLPHPGGGGETYVRMLQGMAGYAFETSFLAPSADRRASVPINALAAQWAAREVDLVHVHGEVAAAACLPTLALKRAVVTLHGLHLLRRSQGVAREAAAASLGLIVRAASRTICVAESEAADVVAAVGDWARPRLAVIPNGVPLPALPRAEERASARAQLGLDQNALVGAWLGALDAHKDPLTAARAARGLPLVLLFAGEGSLKNQVEREGGASVRLVGQLADTRRVLAAADFFVLASQREGLSFALLEAMAMGLAPVVSDAAGNVEAVADAGMVVPYGDVNGFAAAFRRLMETDLRLALARRARERIAAKFGVDAMRERTREVYAAAIAA